MSSITIEVPKGTEKEYKFAFSKLARNYSVEQLEDLEDLLLGYHIQKSEEDGFGKKEDFFKALNN